MIRARWFTNRCVALAVSILIAYITFLPSLDDRVRTLYTTNKGIFFVHVQKTGGTTLRTLFVDKFVRSTPTPPNLQWREEDCYWGNHSCPSSHHIYSNHHAPPASLLTDRTKERSYLLVAMLREPVERLLSWYYFHNWKEFVLKNNRMYNFTGEMWHAPSPNDPKERAGLLSWAKEHQNALCQLLLGANHTEKCSENDVDVVKNLLLKEYDGVLITEDFDASTIYFFKHILKFKIDDISQLCYAKHKVMFGRPTKADLPQDLLRIIEAEFQYDSQIYNFAKQIFNDKLNKIGDSFKRDLEQFKKAQEKYKDKCEADTIMGKFNACIFY